MCPSQKVVSCSKMLSEPRQLIETNEYAQNHFIFVCAPILDDEILKGTEQNSTTIGYLSEEQSKRSLEFQVNNIVGKIAVINTSFSTVNIENKEDLFRKLSTKLKDAPGKHLTLSILGHGTPANKLDLVREEVCLNEILRFLKETCHQNGANITVILAMCYGHLYSKQEFYDEPGFKVIPLTNVKNPCSKVTHLTSYEENGLRVSNSEHKGLRDLLEKMYERST